MLPWLTRAGRKSYLPVVWGSAVRKGARVKDDTESGASGLWPQHHEGYLFLAACLSPPAPVQIWLAQLWPEPWASCPSLKAPAPASPARVLGLPPAAAAAAAEKASPTPVFKDLSCPFMAVHVSGVEPNHKAIREWNQHVPIRTASFRGRRKTMLTKVKAMISRMEVGFESRSGSKPVTGRGAERGPRASLNYPEAQG